MHYLMLCSHVIKAHVHAIDTRLSFPVVPLESGCEADLIDADIAVMNVHLSICGDCIDTQCQLLIPYLV